MPYRNKEAEAAYKKAYYEENKEVIAAYRKAYREKNKEVIAASQKRYREKNKEALVAYNKRYHILSKYGLTLEERNKMQVEQGNACKICLREFNDEIGCCVDHCHTSGKIRGLLCQSCNKGLGHFRDNTLDLARALEYLEDAEDSEDAEGI